MGFTLHKAEQPLPGMELWEKAEGKGEKHIGFLSDYREPKDKRCFLSANLTFRS